MNNGKKNYIGSGRCTLCRNKTSVAHIYNDEGKDVMSVCSNCDNEWYERTAETEKNNWINSRSGRFFR